MGVHVGLAVGVVVVGDGVGDVLGGVGVGKPLVTENVGVGVCDWVFVFVAVGVGEKDGVGSGVLPFEAIICFDAISSFGWLAR